MAMQEALQEALREAQVGEREFREVVQRILSNQVIYRDTGSQREAQFYDLFMRMSSLVTEYLGLMGIEVVVSERWRYVIAYPPGANHPTSQGDPQDLPSLQRRSTREENALLLVARKLFEDRLRSGQIDEGDAALVSLEDLYTAYHALTKERMPEQMNRREAIFKRLRQLRVVDYGDLSDSESVVRIRASVLALTFRGYLDALEDALGDADEDADETEMVAIEDTEAGPDSDSDSEE